MHVVTQQRFGGPEVLEWAEAEKPKPIPTEILVRVHATSVNPVELKVRSGDFPLLGPPPFVLGWDVSGVVEEVVPGTNRFQVGDEVFGMPFFPRPAGAYAEYLTAPSRQLALKPRSVDHIHAAALPLVALTAWQALVDVAHVAPGQRVVIHGGGGGVGHIAIQLAKALGAYVITTSSAAKTTFVRELGADESIDYNAADYSQILKDVDVVFDLIGKGNAQRSLSILRPGGLLITAVERTSEELPALARQSGRRFAGVIVEPDYPALERIAELVDAGKIRPYVEHVVPLQQASVAHEIVAKGSTKGKVALSAA